MKMIQRIRPRTVAIAMAAVVLAWLVVSRSLAAYLADAAPNTAVLLNSHQPDALMNLADGALTAAQTNAVAAEVSPSLDAQRAPAETHNNFKSTFSSFEKVGGNQSASRPMPPADPLTVRRWATDALTDDPLNARALQVLGRLAEAEGNDADAAKFMRASNRLSLHESIATYWLLRNAAGSGDFKAAVHYADVLLRINPAFAAYVVPILGRISEDKDGAALLRAVLAGDPPWRPNFVELLPISVTDPRTPLSLLLSMRNDSVPLTAADVRPYISLLISRGYFGLAYYTWLQFLSPDDLRHAGLLFNGDFESPPSGLPFDWTIAQGSGVTIDIVPRPDQSGAHALFVDFQFGRVDYHSVTEVIMLAPGTYQFKGEYKGQLVGPRGMKWRVVCVNAHTDKLAESPTIIGVAKNWTQIGFVFTVPDKGCSAQQVRLDLDARMASEELVSGSVFFDDLRILRAAGPSAAAGG